MPNEHNGFGSVCAVVVTYNIGRAYLANFAAIKDQVDKIIIVDNGSDDEEVAVLRQHKRTNDFVLVEGGAGMGNSKVAPRPHTNRQMARETGAERAPAGRHLLGRQ